MEKSKEKDNTLIKRKNLMLELNSQGINRISPNAVLSLEKYMQEFLLNLIPLLKETMQVNGVRTLTKEIFQKAIKEKDNKKSNEFGLEV